MRWACLAFIALLPAAQDQAVDLEILATKHVAVQVRINGKGPFRLIFDTGAPITIVSSRAAEAAGLPKSRGLLGMSAPVKADTFEVAGARVKDLEVFVIDHPTVGMIESVVGRLDGIVGFDFYARHRTVIDYQAKKLTFTPIDHDPGNLMRRLQSRLTRIGRKSIQSREVVFGFTVGKTRPIVRSVAEGGAAHAAGLRAGDRIVGFDGRWITSPADVAFVASNLPSDDDVTMKVRRGVEEIELRIRTRFGL